MGEDFLSLVRNFEVCHLNFMTQIDLFLGMKEAYEETGPQPACNAS